MMFQPRGTVLQEPILEFLREWWGNKVSPGDHELGPQRDVGFGQVAQTFQVVGLMVVEIVQGRLAKFRPWQVYIVLDERLGVVLVAVELLSQRTFLDSPAHVEPVAL